MSEVIDSSPQEKCLICCEDFSNFTSEEKLLHVNFCLDSNSDNNNNINNNKDNISDGDQKENMLSDDEDFIEKSSQHLVWCQICGLDISYLSIIHQNKHINQCCTTQQLFNKQKAKENDELENIVMYCSACGLSLEGKSNEYKIIHFKSCHKKNKTKFSELRKLKDGINKKKEKQIKKKVRTRSLEDLTNNTNEKFLNHINKAHYRPQPLKYPIANSIIDPSPPGEKDLAGFPITQKTTQITKKIDTKNCLDSMFSDDESLDFIDVISPNSSNKITSSQNNINDKEKQKSMWKLSTELACASQYKSKILESKNKSQKYSKRNLENIENSPIISSQRQNITNESNDNHLENIEMSPIISSQRLTTDDNNNESNDNNSNHLDDLVELALESSDIEDNNNNNNSFLGIQLEERSEFTFDCSQTTQLSQNETASSQLTLQSTNSSQLSNNSEISSFQDNNPTKIQIPHYMNKLHEIQDWYKNEIKVCEEQKMKAIMEIETKFYTQIGRLAMEKEKKLNRVSSQYNITNSNIILLSQVSEQHTLTNNTNNNNNNNNNKAKKRRNKDFTSTLPNTKKRRLNKPISTTSLNSSSQPNIELNEITKHFNEQLGECIKLNIPLWTKMILQEPVNIKQVQSYIKLKGLGCGLDYLSQYLRAEGILFQKPNKK